MAEYGAESIFERLAAEPDSRVAAQEFERFVIKLLSELALEQNLEAPRVPEQSPARYDAILPTGLADVPGPTAVEIIYRKRMDSQGFLKHMQRALFEALRSQEGFRSVLVVHSLALSSQATQQAWSIAREHEGLQVTIWDRATVERLADRHPNLTRVAADQIFLQGISRATEQSSDWQAQSRDRLADIAKLYSADGVTLLLGAGVSVGSNLPSWSTLIADLFASAFRKQLPAGVTKEELKTLAVVASRLNSDDPLQMARYLRRAITAQDLDFEDTLADAMYRGYSPGYTSLLLIAVARLCVPERNGSRIRQVITYNFDDLLEELLEANGVRCATVYRDHVVPSTRDLPIYHVHGFLPRNRHGFDRLDESLLTFSEEGYHHLWSDPYHWTNIVQLNAFRETTCVLIGLSLNDPNLRRLLELASRGSSTPQHFILMKRIGDTDLKNAGSEVDLIGQDRRAEFLGLHHALQESIAEELGATVVWFESFDDIPAALTGLRE